jgi:glycosyltransferase involved in cell wall biosynthesis
MRVCFLSAGPGPVEHAEALRTAGAEVVVAEHAPEGRFDVVVACGWRAAGEAFRVDARRRVYLVQRLEHRALSPERPERLAAVVALDLPLDLLVTSAWLDDAIAEQHPHARRRRVPLGREDVAQTERTGGALRVAGSSPELLAMCTQPVEAAGEGYDVLVALDEPLVEDLAAPAPPESPLAPIVRAFAEGATCVAVPTEGRDELVVHRENGLVVDPDDLQGAARALDEVAADGELRATLQAGALRTMLNWPTWPEAGARLHAALEDLLASPATYDAAWPAALMADATGEAVKLSAYESARNDAMHAWARQLEEHGRATEPPPSAVDRLRARLRGDA